MSGEKGVLPGGGNSLLRGNRTRSYGSLVRTQLSPVRQGRIEHKIQPGETLQGLALRYGVSMEQIQRANRMYTNDSIFLKKSLSIPVLADVVSENGEADNEAGAVPRNRPAGSSTQKRQDESGERASDMTPVDFLKRLDGLISQSKQAAVRGCQEAEERVAALEAACSSRAADMRPRTRSQSLITSPRMQQQKAAHGAVPLTITKLTKKLRDREDEIFEL